MKLFELTIFTTLIFLTNMFAHAANEIRYRDIKLPTQQMIEFQNDTAPAAASNTVMKALTATSSSLTTTFTTFLAQPEVPRNITITTGGTTADCKLATVVVTGTNFLDAAITENFAIVDNQAGTTTGVKAFKSVVSVAIPAQDGSGCTYSVGVGSKLGLKRCMDDCGHFFHAALNGVKEGTAPTCASSATAIESNTATLSSSLNGTDVQLYFAQNFRCLP